MYFSTNFKGVRKVDFTTRNRSQNSQTTNSAFKPSAISPIRSTVPLSDTIHMPLQIDCAPCEAGRKILAISRHAFPACPFYFLRVAAHNSSVFGGHARMQAFVWKPYHDKRDAARTFRPTSTQTIWIEGMHACDRRTGGSVGRTRRKHSRNDLSRGDSAR